MPAGARCPRTRCRRRSASSPHSRSPPPASFRVTMRNVIVTGGSRGLGLGIARRLDGAGYRVIVIARREGEELAAALRGDRIGALLFRPFDLADLQQIPGLVK